MPRFLAFAGSARAASLNKRLLRVAVARARAFDAEFDVVDLRDHPLPLYDADLEAAGGLPEPVLRWRQILLDHDAFLIACPEYNSSITPLLKNAIDWGSRPGNGVRELMAYRGRVVALLSASPGALGGLRGLVAVRSLLGNIGMHVVPSQLALSRAHEAFTAEGELVDELVAKRLGVVVEELVVTARKLLPG